MGRLIANIGRRDMLELVPLGDTDENEVAEVMHSHRQHVRAYCDVQLVKVREWLKSCFDGDLRRGFISRLARLSLETKAEPKPHHSAGGARPGCSVA